MSSSGACEKCNCPHFFSSDTGLFDHHSTNMAPGWIAKPGRKCRCGHKIDMHTAIRFGAWGAVATYFLDGQVFDIYSYCKDSQAEAEEDALGGCLQVCRNLGGTEPALRISGNETLLAVAQANDGRIGWSNGETYAVAECRAVEYCGDPNPWKVECRPTGEGDWHDHYFGAPYCR